MATISTPVRQPFGVLDESKLRSLQSIKNRQNAINPSPSLSLKRRAPSPEISDSENIDPNQFDLSSKRKRATFDDDVSLSKQPRLMTQIVPSTTKTYTPPAQTRHVEPTKTGTTPLSAPPAAGRSPTRLHTRLDKVQPKRRFAQPSLKTSSPSISIAAALRGTLAHKRSIKSKKQTATLDETKPKAWFFDIFEESEELQDYRMSEWTMTQSSAALDLSDDEGSSNCIGNREKGDKGKENIDPNEMLVTTTPQITIDVNAGTVEPEQTEAKPKSPRTPLGDLNAADFYAEGLDATSVALVHDDAPEEHSVPEEEQQEPEAVEPHDEVPALRVEEFTFEAPLETKIDSEINLANEPIPEWAQKASSNMVEYEQAEENFIYCDPDVEAENIEIWESESAKDENENQEVSSRGCVVIGEGQTISISSACYLQEI